jgi:uncharacterized membrane protein (UPF0127 family)
MRSRIGTACLAALLAVGCSQSPVKIDVSINGVAFRVEVARTVKERENGLMFRKTLQPQEGMIFVFEMDQHLSFWMKDTPLPLSIAFLSSEGKILEIRDMEPFSQSIIRSRFSSRYALEVAQGTFTRIGAKEGDFLVFPPDFK